jgi:hypothetical protein
MEKSGANENAPEIEPGQSSFESIALYVVPTRIRSAPSAGIGIAAAHEVRMHKRHLPPTGRGSRYVKRVEFNTSVAAYASQAYPRLTCWHVIRAPRMSASTSPLPRAGAATASARVRP